MVVQIEIGCIEITVLHRYQDEVVAMEFSEIVAAFIVVEALYIMVEPHFASAQRTATLRFENDAVYVVLREQVASRLTSLDENF